MHDFLRIPTENKPKKRIDWLICFRWLAAASAVFIILMIRLFKPNIIPATYLLITVAALCLCNVFFLSFSRWKRFKKNDSKYYVISTHVQLIFDLLFLTTFLHFLGGLETPFFFFYLIYVSIASIFLPRAFDLVYAGLASSLYLGMLILEWQAVIPHYGTIKISLSRDLVRLIGIVADTGIGIDKEDILHIFDEFYRAKNAKSIERHGTGLGLSIVKRILGKYKGSISVESELGKGSKFTFEIPIGTD